MLHPAVWESMGLMARKIVAKEVIQFLESPNIVERIEVQHTAEVEDLCFHGI